MTPPKMSLLTANLICMASMLAWAIGLPAADFLIGPVPSITLTALRMSLAALALLPVWLLMEGATPLRRARWGLGILVGGLSIGLGAFLLILAQKATDAVTVAVIAATLPVIGIAIECVLDGRKLTLPLVLGLTLSLAGGVLAYGTKIGNMSFGLGAICALVSVVVFALGSRATVTAFPDLSAIGRTAITLSGAAIATSIAAIATQAGGGATIDWPAIGGREILALLIYGLAGMALSQVLWIMSVGHLGIGYASLHINAAPFYVMILLFAMGGSWNWTQAMGAAIVGLGVLIAQGLPTHRTPQLTG